MSQARHQGAAGGNEGSAAPALTPLGTLCPRQPPQRPAGPGRRGPARPHSPLMVPAGLRPPEPPLSRTAAAGPAATARPGTRLAPRKVNTAPGAARSASRPGAPSAAPALARPLRARSPPAEAACGAATRHRGRNGEESADKGSSAACAVLGESSERVVK